MKKNLILSLVLIASIGCGTAVPRQTLLEAKDAPQTYPLSACGFQVTIPAGWAVEKDLVSINDVFVTKDKIDIHIDYMATESDATKIGPKLEEKIEKQEKTNMKINRVAKSKIGGYDAVTLFGTAPGNVSIDIDAFNCPLVGSTAFYVVSPANTWKRDRAIVVDMLKSIKLVEGVKFKK
jgi:hypothetical protein